MQWAMQQAVTSGMSLATAAIFHGGGTVGGGMQVKRTVPASDFAFAQRFHGGGEVPALLQPGERVLSRQQLGASYNQMGELIGLVRALVKKPAANVAVVQSEEQILQVMRSRAGEEAIARATQRTEAL